MKRLAMMFFAITTGVVLMAAATMMTEAKPTIKKNDFGKTADGKKVEIYTLTNSKGSEARIMTYGGAVVSLKVPDKDGKFDDVVLGFDKVADYEKQTWYIGALIGRYGNRIGKGKFTLGGKEYTLETNNNGNHLHGGYKGYDKVVWTARPFISDDGANLELKYLSPDGDGGYPGNLSITATYTLTENNELKIVYSATADRDTLCNLTHHSYFNLAGKKSDSILDHLLTIDADKFTPTDGGSIPTGELRNVAGTPFDFLKPTAMGAHINDNDEQIKFGSGFDHNWVLNHKSGALAFAASVSEPLSGRVMEVWTNEPGLQFYAGNFLDTSIPGKGGRKYPRRSGFCLEAQGFPDSPNKPNFPSTVLKKGETYSQTTVYRFLTK